MPEVNQQAIQFRASILAQQVDKIFDRIANHNIKDTYEADQAALENYLEQAIKLGDPRLQSRIWNILGVLHGTQGHSERAVSAYQQSYEVSLENGHLQGQITSVYNQAGVYFGIGDYAKTVEKTTLALTLIADPALPDRFVTNIRLNSLSTLALALTLLHRFDDAESRVTEFLSYWESPALAEFNRDSLAAMMRVIRRANAMILLVRSNYARANVEIDLFMELSRAAHAHSYTVTGFLLKTMLALRDSSHDTPAETYWRQASDFVDTLIAQNDATVWYIGNHSYLECAGEYEFLGFRQWAINSARKAVQILGTVDDVHRRAAAESLLAQLEPPTPS